MKKIIVVILSLFIVFELMPVGRVEAENIFDNSFYSDEAVSSYTANYYSMYRNGNTGNHARTIDVSFNPTWFDTDAYTYSPELAMLSLKLSMAATNNSDNTNKPDQYIVELYDALGFKYINNDRLDFSFNTNDSIFYPNGSIEGKETTFDEEDPSKDTIGYAIGYKNIVLSTDEDVTLVSVVIRPNDESEWGSNFTLGRTGDHEGFKQSAEKVQAALTKFINTIQSEGCNSKIKVLISGQARGAGVANLLGHYLNENSTTSGASLYGKLKPEDIYTYGFNVPMGADKGNVKNTQYTYNHNYGSGNVSYTVNKDDNIVSFIIPADMTTYVGMEEFGFTRYGRVFNLMNNLTVADYFNSDIYKNAISMYKNLLSDRASDFDGDRYNYTLQFGVQAIFLQNLMNRVANIFTDRNGYLDTNAQQSARNIYYRAAICKDEIVLVEMYGYNADGSQKYHHSIDPNNIDISSVVSLLTNIGNYQNCAKVQLSYTCQDANGKQHTGTMYFTGEQFSRIYALKGYIETAFGSVASLLTKTDEIGDLIEDYGDAIEYLFNPEMIYCLFSTYNNNYDPTSYTRVRTVKIDDEAGYIRMKYNGTQLFELSTRDISHDKNDVNIERYFKVEAYFDDSNNIWFRIPDDPKYTIEIEATKIGTTTYDVSTTVTNINTNQVLENKSYSVSIKRSKTSTLTFPTNTSTVDNQFVTPTVTKEGGISDITASWTSKQYRIGDYIECKLPTGYAAKWKVNGTVVATTGDFKYRLDSSHTSISYVVEKANYNVKYYLYGGKNNSGNPATYQFDEANKTLLDPTRDGYEFLGWYDSPLANANKVTTITCSKAKNIRLYSKWKVINYNVTYNYNNGALSSGSNPSTYTIEDNVTLLEPSKNGYNFDGWYKESGFVNKITKLGNGSFGTLTLYAKYNPINYAITYNLDGGDNNNANPATYNIESSITLQNPTRSGYEFLGWFTDNEFKNEITAIASGQTGDKNLFAKWRALPKIEDLSSVLSDKVSLVIYLSCSSDYQNVNVNYKLNGETNTVALNTLDKQGEKYILKVLLTPDQVEDSIEISFTSGQNELAKQSISLDGYLDALISEAGSDSEAGQLATSLKTYGDYAKKYFDKEEGVAALTFDKDLKDYAYTISKKGAANTIKLTSASLVLNSLTSIKFYYVINSSYTNSDFEFVIKQGADDVASDRIVITDTYVEIQGIKASELFEKFNLTISKDSTKLVDITYSPMSYAYQVFTSSSSSITTNLKNLMATMYDYGAKAIAYVNGD